MRKAFFQKIYLHDLNIFLYATLLAPNFNVVTYTHSKKSIFYSEVDSCSQ
jgi:hypothetical protein